MADITITELTDFNLTTVAPLKGVSGTRIGAVLGVVMATGPKSSAGDGLTILGTGPEQWLVQAETATENWAETIEGHLAGIAAVVDQSSAYVRFRAAGVDARRLLQKGLSIDLSPVAFPPKSVAVSVIAHIGVIVHHVEPDVYDLAVFRSFADSFRHWLDMSIAAL